MDYLDFSEEREILSILYDNKDIYFINGLKPIESNYTILKQEIIAGELLIKGQLVTITSTYNNENSGLPGIVTDIEFISNRKYKYTIKLLTGNLDNLKNNLTIITIKTDDLKESLFINDDYINVIESLKENKLGFSTLFEMKEFLNINHIFWFNENKFISYF